MKITDKTGRNAEIKMYDQNNVEWSNDYFEVGTLKCSDEENEIFEVTDVEYCIASAEEVIEDCDCIEITEKGNTVRMFAEEGKTTKIFV